MIYKTCSNCGNWAEAYELVDNVMVSKCMMNKFTNSSNLQINQ